MLDFLRRKAMAGEQGLRPEPPLDRKELTRSAKEASAVEGGKFTDAALQKLRGRLFAAEGRFHTGFYTTFRMFVNEGSGYHDPDDREEVPVELAPINREPLGYVLPSSKFSIDIQPDRVVIKTWKRKKPIGAQAGTVEDLPLKEASDMDRECAAIQQAFLHMIRVKEIPAQAIQLGPDGRPYVQTQGDGEFCVYTLLPEGTVKFS